MSLPKPPFPRVSSQIELLSGYTCTNDFFCVPADIVPPNFPYALEHDTLGARIPYRYYTGPGPPHPSVGLPGDIYYDSLSDSSSAYASPKGFARTLTRWTPWGGADSLVYHPFLPVYALCRVWDETARTTIAHEWGHVNSTSESRLLEKEVSKADARLGPVPSPTADVEARTHRAGGGDDVLTTLSLCGEPLLSTSPYLKRIKPLLNELPSPSIIEA
ncbi:hypothetical protein FIBSPDRAFT_289431 [Athelia psychrophila]|uniref:Uncharacterized protein n=1 Tax=Athelia psychrophila TaxID=1759441 RepID=A0A167XJ63_9AGAM|nr:hypothetical protein FIBSPDRAFT_289431 [Fibularhizoctonia sp. CBS 109695]